MNIIQKINLNVPFTFAKYGDGEYLCAIKRNGQNCDKTKYTHKLSQAIIASYIYLAPLDNSFLGKWTDDNIVYKFFEKIIVPKWVDYSTFIWGTHAEFLDKMLILKSIKYAKQQKIYVCNENLAEMAGLFNIDTIVKIHPSDWFENDYDLILKQIMEKVINTDSIIIMTSAGMGAKPLLSDLRKIYKNSILLDIGSAFDIFTYKVTRSYNMNISRKEVDDIIIYL
tara:strand:+ start:433 stop:1107 length:675 start_codon:yes stop_codon:yes gene_type:complete